ncbi:MAG: ubiquinone biosynthesis accessory factor UbiJ [Pseudomonadota bacterium]
MLPELAEIVRLPMEKALNAALEADPASRTALHGLSGARIRIDLKGLFSIDLLPQGDVLVITGNGLDAPDATLRASPLGFLRASMRGDLMGQDIELLGESRLTIRAARLLSGIKPDIEMALTPHVGGLLAHQIGRLWRAMGEEMRRFAENRLLDEADFLRDESSMLPRRTELEPWFDAVDRLRDRIEALEARIQRLPGGAAVNTSARDINS